MDAGAADKPDEGVCPVHRVRMERVDLKMVYGMPSKREFHEMRAGKELFPHGRDYVLAGCVVKPKKTMKGYLCPQCVQARREWLDGKREGTAQGSGAGTDLNDRSARAQAMLEEFFAIVNAGDVEEALRSMAPTLLSGEAARDEWRRHLAAIRSIQVMDVKPVDARSWTVGRQKFRVTLEAYVKDSPAAPIPHYGWQDNPNVRWVWMEQGTDGKWRLASLSTGP